jgi:hypothetical protein
MLKMDSASCNGRATPDNLHRQCQLFPLKGNACPISLNKKIWDYFALTFRDEASIRNLFYIFLLIDRRAETNVYSNSKI